MSMHHRPLRLSLSLFGLLLLAACSSGSSYAPGFRAAEQSGEESSDTIADQDRGGASGPAERLLIRSASLYLSVADEASAGVLDRARQLVKDRGGLVLAESRYSLTISVPSAAFDQTLRELEALGEIVDRRVTIQDVTEAHADLNIRIENARKLKQRLHELLSRAQKVEDVLAIERELQRVTNELESMEARLRDMNQRVSMSRIELALQIKEQETRPGPLGWVLYGLYRGVRWLFIWD
ncbi:MAG: DUF4349 domain-containing protein [Leptospirales bacterium]|nr:DUF4349 domain-containing protein [Leptospirales bacterium]